MMSQKYIYPSLFQEEDPHESIPSEKTEYDLTNLFERLAKSDFRSRFHLSKKDREYVMEKGLPTIRKHAEGVYYPIWQAMQDDETLTAVVRSRQLHIYRNGKKILVLAGKAQPKVIREDKLNELITQ